MEDLLVEDFVSREGVSFKNSPHDGFVESWKEGAMSYVTGRMFRAIEEHALAKLGVFVASNGVIVVPRVSGSDDRCFTTVEPETDSVMKVWDSWALGEGKDHPRFVAVREYLATNPVERAPFDAELGDLYKVRFTDIDNGEELVEFAVVVCAEEHGAYAFEFADGGTVPLTHPVIISAEYVQ